jgi:hypothetical protein
MSPVTLLLVSLGPILVQLALFLRWLHRRVRDDEIHRAFLRDVATNHLPHIYSALRLIAGAHGITLDDHPQIQYLEFNGPRKS